MKTFEYKQDVEVQAEPGHRVKWEPAIYDSTVTDMRGWHRVKLLRDRYVNVMSGSESKRDDLHAYVTRVLLVPSLRIRIIENKPATKVTLTRRQREELECLAEAPQSTHNTTWRGGKRVRGRARVQNSLQTLGLAYFCEEDGSTRDISLLVIMASYGNPRPQCRITDKGREVLAQLRGAK